MMLLAAMLTALAGAPAGEATPPPARPDEPPRRTVIPSMPLPPLTPLPPLPPRAPESALRGSPSHDHDGLFLRLEGGFGHLACRIESGSREGSVGGTGPGLALALGMSVSPAVALYGELWRTTASNPTEHVESLALSGIGPGVSVYFGDNSYFSSTLLLDHLVASNAQGSSDSTDVGVGLIASLAREWWIADEWGLGGGFQLALARASENDDHWTMIVANLMMTATFN